MLPRKILAIQCLKTIALLECDTIDLESHGDKLEMATPLNINEDLLQELLALDNHTTVEVLVETALREHIQRRKRLKVLELFGTIDYDEDYDYKQQRQLS